MGSGVVDAGDTVAFDLTVTNNGPSDADAVVVRDELPPGTTAVSVTPARRRRLGSVRRSAAQVACARATMPAPGRRGRPDDERHPGRGAGRPERAGRHRAHEHRDGVDVDPR